MGGAREDLQNAYLGYIFGAQSPEQNKDHVPLSLKDVVLTGAEQICYGAFYGCDGLRSVSVPEGVLSIGEKAFYGCGALENFAIPSSVTEIGRQAFGNCSALTDFTIPDTVREIGFGAFENCNSLAKLTLPFTGRNRVEAAANGHFGYIFGAEGYSQNYLKVPASLKEVVLTDNGGFVGRNAFNSCSNIVNIRIPSNTTAIIDGAFSFCTSLAEIELPETVVSLGEEAFYCCSSLTHITVPMGVTSIGYSAFARCNSPESIALPFIGTIKSQPKESSGYLFGAKEVNFNSDNVPSALKKVAVTNTDTIGANAFRNCEGIAEIVLSDGVYVIGAGAFAGCTKLERVNIPDSVKQISKNAFYLCDELMRIEIPAGVEKVESAAFMLCNCLTIYCRSESRPLGWAEDWNSSCPAVWDCANNEKDEEGYVYAVFNGVRYRLKDGVAGVAGQRASISGDVVILEEISFGGETYTTTSIGAKAFYECTKLKSIAIPRTVKNIETLAFWGCRSLGKINFNGTKAEWVAIDSGEGSFDSSVPVYCTDGEL